MVGQQSGIPQSGRDAHHTQSRLPSIPDAGRQRVQGVDGTRGIPWLPLQVEAVVSVPLVRSFGAVGSCRNLVLTSVSACLRELTNGECVQKRVTD